MITIFKPYLKQMFQHRFLLMLGFFLFVLAGLSGLALLGLSGWFISAAAFAGISAVTAVQFNYLLPSAAVRLFSYLRIVSRYGERLINHEVVFRLIADIRLSLFHHLTQLSPQQWVFVKNSDLLNRFMNDVGILDNLFLRIISPCLSVVVLLVFLFVFLSFVSFSVALVSFLGLLLLMFLLAILLKPNQQTIDQYQYALNELRSLATQTMDALREISLFGAKQGQLKLFEHQLSELSKVQTQLNKKNNQAQSVLILGIGCLMVIALLMMIKSVGVGHLNGANIALVVLILLAFGEELNGMVSAFLLVGQTKEAAVNVNAVMAIKPWFEWPKEANFILKQGAPRLSIKNLCFYYPNQNAPIFDQLNITFSGQSVITGPSGVGKSTLISLIARFMKPQSGEILINDHDLFSLTDKQWQSVFCIVPQKAYLFDTTLRENLLLANPNATTEQCWEALEICQMKSFVASLPNGLETYIGQNGERLSGGQARRIGLARAILKNAPITILDEPTEGLDQPTEIALIKSCQDYFKDKTLLVVSHRKAVTDLFPSKNLLKKYDLC